MADDGTKQDATWPLPVFSFEVSWGAQQKASFQEVGGLETETQVIEYRHGDSPIFSNQKMPGLVKFGNVTLKRGVFVADNPFWTWFNSIKQNTVKRETVIVRLLDEKGNPTMTWTLRNAWPTKVSGPSALTDGGKVLIQTIELAHEGVTVASA